MDANDAAEAAEIQEPTRSKVLRFASISAVCLLGVVLSAWALLAWLQPGPKGRIIMATGGGGGAYQQLALTLQKDLARNGVQLELRPNMDSVTTVNNLILNKESDLQAGFIKGGVAGSLQGRYATAEEHKWHDLQVEKLRSVGRVMLEPIWVFYRGRMAGRGLDDLKGKRILVGTVTSGSRRVATHMLMANGVDAKNSTIIEQDLDETASQLLNGTADAAFVILPPESKKVQALLRVPGIFLMNFAAEADAYTNRFPALSKIVMHQSSIEFAPDIPSADITLLATMTALVVRTDMHPALVSVLTDAVVHNPKSGFDPSGEPVLFFKSGQFPTASDPEFEMSAEARVIYKSGELPFLLRGLAPAMARMGLPFWPAALANAHAAQFILLLIPVLSILIPLMRLLPMLYNWSMRRRLLYWYNELKQLEASLEPTPTQSHLFDKIVELDRIDEGVSRINVPLHFSDQLYDLRGHIDLVRQRLMPREGLRSAA
jgi:uncharacterized protein